MAEWQKLVTKMIGDDVSGSFANNLAKATFSEDFISSNHAYVDQPQLDAFWIPTGTPGQEIRGNFATKVIDWDFERTGDPLGNRTVSFDLFKHGKFDGRGSLAAVGNWAIRWKMVFGSGLVSPTTNTNAGTIGLFDNADLASDAVQSFMGYRFSMDSGGSHDIALVTGNAATPDTPTTTNTFVTQFASDTILFFELKRTADGNIEGTIYSDADYSVIVEKIKVTGIAIAIDDLRFMKVMNTDNLTGDGNFKGTIPELELFNESEGLQDFFTAKGVEKATSFDVIPDLITEQKVPDFIADLFVTTGWVESGASEVRQIELAGLIECLVDADGGQDGITNDLSLQILDTPDFADDFSADNWTQVGTRVTIPTPTLDFTNPASTSFEDSETVDMLGVTVSDSLWVLRFKYRLSVLQGGSGGNQDIIIILSDEPSTSPVSNPQRFIGIRQRNGTFQNIAQNVGDLRNAPANDSFVTAVPVIDTDFYIEVKRTAVGSVTTNIYSDAQFTNLIESHTNVIAALIDMRYLKVMSWQGTAPFTQGTRVITGIIDNVQFWDGVSTPPFITTVSDTAWVLRGSFSVANFNGQNTSDKTLFVGLFPGVQPPTLAQDSIFLAINSNSDFSANKTGDAWIGHSDGTLPQNATEVPFTYDAFQPMLEGRYFFELKRTSATTIECTIFDERGFSFPLQTIFQTIPATVTGLRYISLQARIGGATGRITMYFDTFEFFNGVTNACTFNTTPVLEQDTAQARMNYCDANIFYSGIDDNTNDSISVDLGTPLSDSGFVMRCAINVVDNNVAVSSTPLHWIGLTSTNSTQNGSVSQEGIALRVDPTLGNYAPSHGFGTDPQSGWTNEADYTDLTITNGQFFLEIVRVSTTQVRMSLYRDKLFNDLIQSRTFTISASIVNLQFLKIMNRQVAATTAFWEVIVTNIQIWDNVNNVDGFNEFRTLDVQCKANALNGIIRAGYLFNAHDESGDYHKITSINNAADVLVITNRFLDVQQTPSASDVYSFLKVFNRSGNMFSGQVISKETHGYDAVQANTFGPANVPDRIESVGMIRNFFGTEKINKIQVRNDQAGIYDTDSEIIVLATD